MFSSFGTSSWAMYKVSNEAMGIKISIAMALSFTFVVQMVHKLFWYTSSLATYKKVSHGSLGIKISIAFHLIFFSINSAFPTKSIAKQVDVTLPLS